MPQRNRVWFTEKPSAAKDLIAGMRLAYGCVPTNSATSSRDGFFQLSNGDVVVPLRGHIVSTVKPGAYLSDEMAAIEAARDYAKYRQFLPLIPDKLITTPRVDEDEGKGQKGQKKGRGSAPFLPYRAAKQILKNPSVLRDSLIINAGDTDREGQLIVDEMLQEFGIDPGHPNIQRVELVSNRAEDIAKTLTGGTFEHNGSEKWSRRGEAARTRQYLDFVWGMNFSMAFQALIGRANTAIGRVQTPVLNIVAERDKAIANFVPRDYFVPVITLRDGTIMRWHKREDAAGMPGFDEEGRIIDKAVAVQIARAVMGGLKGSVTQSVAKDHREAPPLMFSLGKLQAHAAREHGMTLEEVEEAAKNLYKDKFISYIGTDCQFLPESMHADARGLMQQLSSLFPGQVQGAHLSIKSKAFNDAKLDEHFAITPMAVPERRPAPEMAVFRTIAKRFICQFYPDHLFRTHALVGSWGKDEFRATAREEIQPGWKQVEADTETSDSRETAYGAGGEVEVDADGQVHRSGG